MELVMKNNQVQQLFALLASALCALMLGPPLAAAEPISGGTLVVGVEKVPRSFNSGAAAGAATAFPSAQIFASPLRFDDKWNPHPYLAEKWELAEDGLSLTLHLVKNAVFHDGMPITSRDVAFSVMAIKENHPFGIMLKPVTGVDTPDDHTAVIRMSTPHPAILLIMSPALMPIMPRHVYGNGEDFKTHPAQMKPVGSGPFTMTEYVPGEHYILERFDKFFIPGRPYLDKIVVRIIPDVNNLVLSVERGDVDFIQSLQDIRAIQRLKKDDSLVITDKGYEGVGALQWLAFNTKQKPLDDVRVRKAIAYAADRDFVNNKLLQGVPQPAYGPIAPSSPLAAKDLERYKLNLDKANALLDEAGYKRNKDGIRFELQVDHEANVAMQRTIAEYLRPQLRKIGIAVTVRSSPDLPSWARRISNFEYDMTVSMAFNWGDPTIGVARLYYSTNIKKGVVWANMQQYANPKVDELLNAAASEMDPRKRAELYAEFQRIIVDEVPILIFHVPPFCSVFKKGLAGLPLTIWGPFSPLDELYWEKRP